MKIYRIKYGGFNTNNQVEIKVDYNFINGLLKSGTNLKIIKNNPGEIVLLGKLNNNDVLVKITQNNLNRLSINQDNIIDFLRKLNYEFRSDEQNEEHNYFYGNSLNEPNLYNIHVITPVTSTEMDKVTWTQSPPFYLRETPEIYQHHQAFMKTRGPINWLQNIFDGNSEQSNIILRDIEDDFILTPDTKGDSFEGANFLIFFDARHGIKSIRDLKIPMPSIKIQNKIAENIQNELRIVEGNKKLIEIYPQKIEDRINKIWEA